MGFVDIAILLILAIAVLGGFYRGFVETVLGLFATVLSWIVGMICTPFVSGAVRANESLYSMLLYYTEGSEYVAATSVELVRTPIEQISVEQLNTVVENAAMPIPMSARVMHNIATETFSGLGITTLGDYFNQTIVAVVINIAAFLLVFFAVRIVLALFIRGVEYGRGGYPVLQRADGAIGAGVGLLQGVLVLFALFMLLPIALTVVPKVYEYVEESFFGMFFYRANIFLLMMPGT